MMAQFPVLLGSAFILGSAANAVAATVPGSADPWLAGMPNGATASYDYFNGGYDTAPAQSPTQVTEVPITAGAEFTFTASGLVSRGIPSSSGPDGHTNDLASHYAGPENGIASLTAPFEALVGVFLGSDEPDSTPAPPALDFSTEASRNYSVLSPQLKQPFFIGDGLTTNGTVQRVVAPAGATRLFLGTMDLYGWANNTGSFSVSVGQGPLLSIRFSEVEICWPSQSNRTYQVQYNSGLSNSAWMNLGPPVQATNTTQCVRDPLLLTEPRRFYRVLQL